MGDTFSILCGPLDVESQDIDHNSNFKIKRRTIHRPIIAIFCGRGAGITVDFIILNT